MSLPVQLGGTRTWHPHFQQRCIPQISPLRTPLHRLRTERSTSVNKSCRSAHCVQQTSCDSQHVTLAKQVRIGAVALGAFAAVLFGLPGQGAKAFADEKVGEFAGSGLIFKDTVEVKALEDPEIEGVTIYISDFRRSIADKLAKDFFTEPSQASVTCAATGPIRVKDFSRIRGSDGHEVFSERKSVNLFQNKTLRVRRILDEARQTLLYVAYSTRLSTTNGDGGISSGRYKTSLCALPFSAEVTRAGSETLSQALTGSEN